MNGKVVVKLELKIKNWGSHALKKQSKSRENDQFTMEMLEEKRPKLKFG